MQRNTSAGDRVVVRSGMLAVLLVGGMTAGILAGDAEEPPAGRRNRLWYAQPAAKWIEALPLGNGRLGAMVFGTGPTERLQLNLEESTGTAAGECH